MSRTHGVRKRHREGVARECLRVFLLFVIFLAAIPPAVAEDMDVRAIQERNRAFDLHFAALLCAFLSLLGTAYLQSDARPRPVAAPRRRGDWLFRAAAVRALAVLTLVGVAAAAVVSVNLREDRVRAAAPQMAPEAFADAVHQLAAGYRLAAAVLFAIGALQAVPLVLWVASRGFRRQGGDA